MERGPGHGRPGGLGAADPAARAAPAAPRRANPTAPSALLDHRARPGPVRGDRGADRRPPVSRNLDRASGQCGGVHRPLDGRSGRPGRRPGSGPGPGADRSPGPPQPHPPPPPRTRSPGPARRVASQSQWVERLEAEAGNLAAAVRWYLTNDLGPLPPVPGPVALLV